MSNPSKRKRRVPWAAIVGLLLLAYPISVVPFDWLTNHGYIDVANYPFYAPLGWVFGKMPDAFRDWYFDLVS